MRIGDRVTNFASMSRNEGFFASGSLTGTIIEIGTCLYSNGRKDYDVNAYTVKWDKGFTDWHTKKHLRKR
uniref:Uncharacterized protein n=1 Tax=viral metagenome TaxID=1070528 RepID=A0A6M3J2A2_9ZZZZ